MIKIKVPGKLYLAGEYAVVEPGNSAIIFAVNKFIHVNIKKTKNIGKITSFNNEKIFWNYENDKLVFQEENEKFSYVYDALKILNKYLSEKDIKLGFLDIEIISKLDSDTGIKYGLGSSGAVVVAIIKAVLTILDIKFTKLDLYKLSVLASFNINKHSSYGDIAASSFTGIIKYNSFDRGIIKKFKTITEALEKDWKSLSIKNIDINPSYRVLVGWTGSPASSLNMVKNSITKDIKKDDLFNYSDNIVDKIVDYLKVDDYKSLAKYINLSRGYLNEYSNLVNITIETEKIKKLIEIANNYGLAAKSSGAGGGDCGIAIYTTDMDIKNLIIEWQNNEITYLDLKIYEE